MAERRHSTRVLVGLGVSGPGRDKERCNVVKEGSLDPGTVAIAKVHVKVKMRETNRKHKPRRDEKEDRFMLHGPHSVKIGKQKSLHCCFDKIR